MKKLIIPMIMLLITGASSLSYGQGRNRSCSATDQPGYTQLTGLTDQQIAQIKEKQQAHQSAMTGLREKMRSTTDQNDKQKIKTEMDQLKTSHKQEIRSLLTADQQKEFDSKWSSRPSNHKSKMKTGNNYGGNRRGNRF
jgi:hypothetical protein